MAYTRQYPNNIAPNGTSIKDGFKNDDNEIKRIYSILDTKGSSSNSAQTLSHGDRQRILSAADTYITASNTTRGADVFPVAGILAEEVPMKISFAAGYTEDGNTPIEHVELITADKEAAWVLDTPRHSFFDSVTNYLYIKRDRLSGLLSYGVAREREQYGTSFPSAAKANQFFFNTAKMKMYTWTANTWEEVQVVFVADITLEYIGGDAIYKFNVTQRGSASPLTYESLLRTNGEHGVVVCGRDGKPAKLSVSELDVDIDITHAVTASRLAKPITIGVRDATSILSQANLDGTGNIMLDISKMKMDSVPHCRSAEQADWATKAGEATTAEHAGFADKAIKADEATKAWDSNESASANKLKAYTQADSDGKYAFITADGKIRGTHPSYIMACMGAQDDPNVSVYKNVEMAPYTLDAVSMELTNRLAYNIVANNALDHADMLNRVAIRNAFLHILGLENDIDPHKGADAIVAALDNHIENLISKAIRRSGYTYIQPTA